MVSRMGYPEILLPGPSGPYPGALTLTGSLTPLQELLAASSSSEYHISLREEPPRYGMLYMRADTVFTFTWTQFIPTRNSVFFTERHVWGEFCTVEPPKHRDQHKRNSNPVTAPMLTCRPCRDELRSCAECLIDYTATIERAEVREVIGIQ